MPSFDMPPNKWPAHGLFIRYGKFEVVAHGRLAVFGFLVILGISALIALRYFGLL